MIDNALASLRAAGLGDAVFSDIQANPVGRNVDDGVACLPAQRLRRRHRLRRRQRARRRQDHRADGRANAPAVGLRGPRGLVHAGERRRHGADDRRPHHGRHRLRGGPCIGHPRRIHAPEEDHLPPEDAAGGRHRRPRAHDRTAAAHHRGHRDGRTRALPGSLLCTGLSSARRRHRAGGHAPDQGVAAGRGQGREERGRARAHAGGGEHGRHRLPEGPGRHPLPQPPGRRALQHPPRRNQRRGDALRACLQPARDRGEDDAAGALSEPARSRLPGGARLGAGAAQGDRHPGHARRSGREGERPRHARAGSRGRPLHRRQPAARPARPRCARCSSRRSAGGCPEP